MNNAQTLLAAAPQTTEQALGQPPILTFEEIDEIVLACSGAPFKLARLIEQKVLQAVAAREAV